MKNFFQRSRQERIEFSRAAAEHYSSAEGRNVRNVFEEDFWYWTEYHFNSLRNTVISSISDVLINHVVLVRKTAGLKMSTTLLVYMKITRTGAGEENEISSDNNNEEILK